jgi:hypothetical protein
MSLCWGSAFFHLSLHLSNNFGEQRDALNWQLRYSVHPVFHTFKSLQGKQAYTSLQQKRSDIQPPYRQLPLRPLRYEI